MLIQFKQPTTLAMPFSSPHPAAFASILTGQFYLRRVPMNVDHGPEGLGETREPFERKNGA